MIISGIGIGVSKAGMTAREECIATISLGLLETIVYNSPLIINYSLYNQLE